MRSAKKIAQDEVQGLQSTAEMHTNQWRRALNSIQNTLQAKEHPQMELSKRLSQEKLCKYAGVQWHVQRICMNNTVARWLPIPTGLQYETCLIVPRGGLSSHRGPLYHLLRCSRDNALIPGSKTIADHQKSSLSSAGIFLNSNLTRKTVGRCQKIHFLFFTFSLKIMQICWSDTCHIFAWTKLLHDGFQFEQEYNTRPVWLCPGAD